MSGDLGVTSLDQIDEFQSMRQVGVFSSLVQEVLGDLLMRFKEVLVESSVSSFLEVLVLDVLQLASLLGGLGLGGFSLGLDGFSDVLGSFSNLGSSDSLSGDLVFRAGFKSLTTESSVVYKDGFKVLEGILAGASEDSEAEGGVVEGREGESAFRARYVVSSHKRISPVVKLEDKSVVILEVKDAEGSHSSKDGGGTSEFLDFGFFEEEDFNTLSFTRFEIEGFHCEFLKSESFF